MRRYDVIVVGAGAMGSAIAAHLGMRGKTVALFDQFAIPNDRGSSHGLSRIIRIAYYEHESYVPLLVRAAELWSDLEQRCGDHIFVKTGSIDASAPRDAVFEGSLRSCLAHGLRHEVLTSAELTRRFPAFQLPRDHAAVFQPDGGFLLPEKAIGAYARLAAQHGADIRPFENVRAWTTQGDDVEVRTDAGIYGADQLVLAAGPWMADLVPSLRRILQPERQVVGWFAVRDHERFTPAMLPVFNLTVEEGRYYGFPEHGEPGFKVGRYHHLGEHVHPDSLDRTVRDADVSVLQQFVERYFVGAGAPALRTSVCMFTNTPDEHFIIDRLPGAPNVLLVSACSGHGFKFAAVIGEIIADLATTQSAKFDLSLFSLGRFSSTR